MRFPEGEPISDTGEEIRLEDYLRYLGEVEAEVMGEALENDPVARLHYAIFTSYSKGRGRKRKYPVEVELVGPGRKKCIQLKEDGSGGLDRLAEQTLRGIVPADEALSEFIQRVRDLDKQRKIVRGER